MKSKSTHTICSHDHGIEQEGSPHAVEVSFLGGDYAKDKKATVRLRIIPATNLDRAGRRYTSPPLASVDLTCDQARQLGGSLMDIASQVAATEGRR